jgi:hypothetical protein
MVAIVQAEDEESALVRGHDDMGDGDDKETRKMAIVTYNYLSLTDGSFVPPRSNLICDEAHYLRNKVSSFSPACRLLPQGVARSGQRDPDSQRQA